MTTERMIRDLEATKKSFEGKFVGTGEVNVVWMIEEIVKFVKAQESDAELGRAVRLAFYKKRFYMKETGMLKTGIVIETEKDLLEWARERVK